MPARSATAPTSCNLSPVDSPLKKLLPSFKFSKPLPTETRPPKSPMALPPISDTAVRPASPNLAPPPSLRPPLIIFAPRPELSISSPAAALASPATSPAFSKSPVGVSVVIIPSSSTSVFANPLVGSGGGLPSLICFAVFPIVFRRSFVASPT